MQRPGPGHLSTRTRSPYPGKPPPAPQPVNGHRVVATGEREEQEAGIAALIALAQATEMATLVRSVRAPVVAAPAAFPGRTGQHGQKATRPVSVCGILAVAATLLATWLITWWPAARWLVYTAWMMPLIELALLVAGQVRFRWGFRRAQPGTFRQLIIQITTAGREQDRVNEIIRRARWNTPAAYAGRSGCRVPT